MMFIAACRKAQQDSKAGYVQHVNKVNLDVFTISNWYDDDLTVASFENGKQIGGKFLIYGDTFKEQLNGFLYEGENDEN